MASLVLVTSESETDASPETKFPFLEFPEIMKHGKFRYISNPKAIKKNVNV